MKSINKKIIVTILVIIEIMLINVTYKSYSNRIIDEKEIENKRVAIKVDNGNKEYKDSETLPGRGYVLNTELTKCLDIEGNKIENIKLDSNGENITITGSYTSYCTLYFDEGENLIKDLSGHNNNGLNYAVLTNEEGVTTSKDEKVGYVDCGLTGYDFKNSITIIVRAKVNKSPTEYNARLISNGSNLNEIAINLTGNRVSSVHFRNNWFGFSKSININEYYTFVSKYDANNCNLFINGDDAGKEICKNSSYISNNSFYLGGSPDYDNSVQLSVPLMATYSDVLIFDTALTDAEIKEYFSGEIEKDKVINNYVNNNQDKKLLLYYRFIN